MRGGRFCWKLGWEALKRTPTTFALMLTIVAGTAGAQTLHMPPHEKYVLKNGLTVLLLEKHGVPMINLFAIVKTGSAADPVGEEGLASITAGRCVACSSLAGSGSPEAPSNTWISSAMRKASRRDRQRHSLGSVS